MEIIRVETTGLMGVAMIPWRTWRSVTGKGLRSAGKTLADELSSKAHFQVFISCLDDMRDRYPGNYWEEAGITFRSMTRSDIEPLSQIFPRKLESLRAVTRRLERRAKYGFVAEKNGQVVAATWQMIDIKGTEPWVPAVMADSTAGLRRDCNTFVTPAYRNVGIARRLTLYSRSHSASQGAQLAVALVHSQNQGGIRLQMSCGSRLVAHWELVKHWGTRISRVKLLGSDVHLPELDAVR